MRQVSVESFIASQIDKIFEYLKSIKLAVAQTARPSGQRAAICSTFVTVPAINSSSALAGLLENARAASAAATSRRR
jgi:hypothetical protein